MTQFEVAYVEGGMAIRRMFKSRDELCKFLERFKVTRECRASVKEVEK
jgi:hypothetical protein